MKKQFLECGKIVTTHGIKGEVKVQPWCDSPDFLLDFETLFLRRGETPLTVERARVQKNMVVLKIAGVDTPEAAAALRNQWSTSTARTRRSGKGSTLYRT